MFHHVQLSLATETAVNGSYKASNSAFKLTDDRSFKSDRVPTEEDSSALKLLANDFSNRVHCVYRTNFMYGGVGFFSDLYRPPFNLAMNKPCTIFNREKQMVDVVYLKDVISRERIKIWNSIIRECSTEVGSLFLGSWAKYAKFIYKIREQRTQDCEIVRKKLLPAMQPEVLRVLDCVPFMKSLLLTIPQNFEGMETFSMFPVICMNTMTKGSIGRLHYDEGDTGVAIIVYFGDFRARFGGHLHFPNLNITFMVQPGDVIIVKGSDYQHMVTEITEECMRYSMVFFCKKEHLHMRKEKFLYFPVSRGVAQSKYDEIYPEKASKRREQLEKKRKRKKEKKEGEGETMKIGGRKVTQGKRVMM